MKKSNSDLVELTIDDLIKKFEGLYKAEIFDNKLGENFRRSFGASGMNEEGLRERLLDKKFGRNYLVELKKAGYDMAVPYGSVYKTNTSPPMLGNNSQLAAALVYSKAHPGLAPIVVELGNRVKDSLVINDTIISATARKIDISQKAANFIPLLKPGKRDYSICFTEGNATCVGKIPSAINNQTYFAGTREETARMVESALIDARKTLPDAMQAAGSGYAVRTVDDIEASNLNKTPSKGC